jgi:hypothetical protein
MRDQAPKPDSISRMPAVIAQTGLPKTSLLRLIKRREFPQPVRLSSRAIASGNQKSRLGSQVVPVRRCLVNEPIRHRVGSAPQIDRAAASDQELLDASPSFLSIGDLFKATPASEGDERFIYLEASNETRDLQGEVLLAKALDESADHFLRFGNLDLEHFTILGRPNPRTGYKGLDNYEDYEIGRPIDVRVDGLATFVKARIASGTGPYATKANRFWSSITELNPPKRWFPSVGGAVLAKSVQIDADTGDRYPVINKVRWSNIGMSLNPVNQGLASCSTVPFGILAKCWGDHGIDMRKSLEAGYGSDSATLTGGSAIRTESLDRSTKRKILALAMTALKAHRITGTEATKVEADLNQGAVPKQEILDRIFGRTR